MIICAFLPMLTSSLSRFYVFQMCAPNVVMQFARVAHATDFLYCYSIIEANRRLDYGSCSKPDTGLPRPNASALHLSSRQQPLHAELNTFFPFDPCRLPRSSSYIEGVYREWSSVAIDDDDDDDDDEDEDEGEAEDEEDDVQDVHDDLDNASDKIREELFVGAIGIGHPRISAEDSVSEGLGASFGGMSISPAHPKLITSLAAPMSVS